MSQTTAVLVAKVQDQNVSRWTNSLGGEMRSLGARILSVAAAMKALQIAGAFLRDSISAAVDEGEEANKFLVVFGEQAEATGRKLDQLAESTNRNRFELRSMAAGIQDMLVPMGVARDEAADLSVQFVTLATDLSSFNNVPVAEVLMAIRSALAGQTEPLRRYGVDVSVAALQQQAWSMGLQGTWQEMDRSQKAMVLYAKVVADTSDAQGDAVRTSGDVASQLVGLKSGFEEAKVVIGQAFIPVLQELIPELKDLGSEALPVIIDIAQRIAEDVQRYGPLTIDIMKMIVDVVKFLVQNYEVLETTIRRIQAITSLGLSEALILVRDLLVDNSREALDLSQKLQDLEDHVIRNRRETYEYAAETKGLTEEQIRLNDEIGKAINLYRLDTDAKIDMAIAAGEAAIAQLELLSATSSGLLVFDESIARIQTQIDKLRTLSKTVGEVQSAMASGGTAGGGETQVPAGPRPDVQSPFSMTDEQIQEAAAQASDQAGQIAQAAADGYMAVYTEEMLEGMRAADAQMAAEAQKAWEIRYNFAMKYSTQAVDMFVDSWFDGFDDLGEAFKGLLQSMVGEIIKSGILTMLSGIFGGGAVGIFGGLGFANGGTVGGPIQTAANGVVAGGRLGDRTYIRATPGERVLSRQQNIEYERGMMNRGNITVIVENKPMVSTASAAEAAAFSNMIDDAIRNNPQIVGRYIS